MSRVRKRVKRSGRRRWPPKHVKVFDTVQQALEQATYPDSLDVKFAGWHKVRKAMLDDIKHGITRVDYRALSYCESADPNEIEALMHQLDDKGCQVVLDLTNNRQKCPALVETLREAIKASELTVTEIARWTGIDQSALNRIVNGTRNNLRADVADKLMDFLGLGVVPLRDLVQH